MSKNYTLHDTTWNDPHAALPPRAYARRRRRNTGPDREIALMREEGWPEFIPKRPYDPTRLSHHKKLHPDVKKARAEARAARALTPEQRKARAHARYMADPDRKAKAHAAYLRQKAKGKRGGPAEYARYTPEQKARKRAKTAAWRIAHRHDPVTRAKNAAYMKKWQAAHRPSKPPNPQHPQGPDGRFINKQLERTTT